MAYDRATLHVSKIDAFASWMAERGWARQRTQGHYQVLRLEHPLRTKPLIFYRRDRTNHATVQRCDYWVMPMIRKFIRETRVTK